MVDQLWMVREACSQLADGKVTTRKVKKNYSYLIFDAKLVS